MYHKKWDQSKFTFIKFIKFVKFIQSIQSITTKRQ